MLAWVARAFSYVSSSPFRALCVLAASAEKTDSLSLYRPLSMKMCLERNIVFLKAWGSALKEKSSANMTTIISMYVMPTKRKNHSHFCQSLLHDSVKQLLNVFTYCLNPWQALAVAADLRSWQSSTHWGGLAPLPPKVHWKQFWAMSSNMAYLNWEGGKTCLKQGDPTLPATILMGHCWLKCLWFYTLVQKKTCGWWMVYLC